MDRRETETSKKTKAIIAEITTKEDPFLMGYPVDEGEASAIRCSIYAHLTRQGKGGTITMTHKNGMLYIGTKNPSRVLQLENMIRKLAMHVDDERLYEEALALVKNI